MEICPEGGIMKDQLSASEAVYGFAAWLTSSKKTILFGSTHAVPTAIGLVDEFCKANDLSEPHEHWEQNLIQPKMQ